MDGWLWTEGEGECVRAPEFGMRVKFMFSEREEVARF